MLKTNRLFFRMSMILLLTATICPAKDIEDEFNTKIFIKSLTNLGNFKGLSSIRWSADGNRLLVDRLKNSRLYNVQILDWEKILDERKDAAVPVSDRRNGSTVQNWNNSTPSWTRDGRYVVFSGQNEFGRNLGRSGPYFGMDCDLWIHDTQQNGFWKFNPNYPDEERILGATAPDFSPDGRLLLWTVTVGSPRTGQFYGRRRLAMAPVFLYREGAPRLSREVHLLHVPGAQDFAESYGFSPDGKCIIFAANLNRPDGRAASWFNMDIHCWDIKTKGSTPVALTANNSWNRHAAFSPRGRKITWSSGAGFLLPSIGMQGPYWNKYLSSELWIMDADGRNQKRLTRFNDRNAPEYMGRRCYVSANAWHPDGRKIAVAVNTEGTNFTPESHLFILELEAGIRTPGGTLVPLKALRAREKSSKKRPATK